MATSPRPLVAVVMGSDSDLPVMQAAADVLTELGIGCTLQVMSAHRTPDRAAEFARTARQRGLRVIIAGAGGAAHLAGVMAGHTTLPVIGVPIGTKLAGGLDSLLSTVQMPKGVPVATVAVDGGRNAGILAAQMLAIADEGLAAKLEQMKAAMAAEVEERSRKVEGG